MASSLLIVATSVSLRCTRVSSRCSAAVAGVQDEQEPLGGDAVLTGRFYNSVVSTGPGFAPLPQEGQLADPSPRRSSVGSRPRPGRDQIAAARPSQVPVTQPDDPVERQAEHLADKVAPRSSGPRRPLRSPFAHAPSVVWDALATPPRSLAAHELEAAVGAEPSNVQIHEGPKAAESAQALNTAAYTVGNHVVLSDAYSRLQAREAGKRLIAHELAHVAQHARTSARPLLLQRLPVPPKLQDPFDPFKKVLEEEEQAARRRPPPPAPPVPITPGDRAEQIRVFRVSGEELWDRPDVQSTMKSLAEQVEADEGKIRPGKVIHTKIAMINFWEESFTGSVEYILTKRDTTKDPVSSKSVTAQTAMLHELQREEAKLQNSTKDHDALVAQVTTLRATFKHKWDEKVDHAVKRFLQLAESQAELLPEQGQLEQPFVFGLPAGLEKTVTFKEAPGQLEAGAKVGVAASVVRFMKAIQQVSGTTAIAENYEHHADQNPHFKDFPVGEYSFDVHLPIHINPDTGFYDTAAAIKFFEAVEQASNKPDVKVEWMALYNDAEVIKKFNKSVGKARIVFVGGSHGGTFHHGPEPYILHVHFNIMPKDLADKFLTVRHLEAEARKIFEAFLGQSGALF